MGREPLRAEQPQLLGRVPHEEHRALGLDRALRQRARDRQERHAARAVVVGSVGDRVAIHRRLDADVIEVRA